MIVEQKLTYIGKGVVLSLIKFIPYLIKTQSEFAKIHEITDYLADLERLYPGLPR